MKLELTDKQVRVVINALDIYSRIGMLQLDAVAHLLGDLGLHQDPWKLKESFDFIKHDLFALPPGASHGICSPKVPDVCKIAYDIQCVIRKDIAERENHPRSSVWHGEPLHTCKAEPLVTIG